MSFQKSHWLVNNKNRTDLTGYLTHLTRPTEEYPDPTDILIKILNERILRGSSKGYIIGGHKVVCFQDIPLYSVAENAINHIEEYERGNAKLRYYPCGLAFPKESLSYLVDAKTKIPIPNSGVRPVIYEKSDVARNFLPEEQHWRIVDLDISGLNSGGPVTDWTHEREWRLLGDVEFFYNTVTVLLRDGNQFRNFISKINPNILRELGGIVVLDTLLY